MGRRWCDLYADSRSALVDGSIGDAEREALLRHLIGCCHCRDEVTALQRVRDLLGHARAASPSAAAPDELSARLVSIAGSDATAPLRASTLSERRTGLRGRRLVAASVLAAAVAAAGTGYAAGAGAHPTAIADPVPAARSEFADVLTDLPLSNPAVTAVMMSDPTSLSSGASAPATPEGESVGTEAAAVVQLQRAASSRLSYRGEQDVRFADSGSLREARVAVVSRPGQGSEVTVEEAAGHPRPPAFVPVTGSSRIETTDLLTVLAAGYELSTEARSSAAGRPAVVVEARQAGVLAARWWVDEATGLLLRRDTYDRTGALVQSAGFEQLRVGDETGAASTTGRLAISSTTAALTLSSADALATEGWYCSSRLAGLSLVRLRADSSSAPGVVHMVFSDGVSTVSVFEQHGALGGAPTGSRWDSQLQAWTRAGLAPSATWQSGSTVFTVVADADRQVLVTAVASLPHDRPSRPTTLGRVHAGWARILSRLFG